MHEIKVKSLGNGRFEIFTKHVTPFSRHTQDVYDSFIRTLAVKREMPLIMEADKVPAILNTMATLASTNKPLEHKVANGFRYDLGLINLIEYSAEYVSEGTVHYQKLMYTPPRIWKRPSKKSMQELIKGLCLIPVAVGSYRPRLISPDVIAKRLPVAWCLSKDDISVHLPETTDVAKVNLNYETTKAIDEEQMVQVLREIVRNAKGNAMPNNRKRRAARKKVA